MSIYCPHSVIWILHLKKDKYSSDITQLVSKTATQGSQTQPSLGLGQII